MSIEQDIRIGMSYSMKRKVDTKYTAGAFHGSGVLDVLFSTPALVSMTLEAALELLGAVLPADFISVVSKCEVHHDHPTMLGEEVTVKVKVVKVEGHRVYLDMEASDGAGIIGHGKIEKVIVNKAKLLEKACGRLDRP